MSGYLDVTNFRYGLVAFWHGLAMVLMQHPDYSQTMHPLKSLVAGARLRKGNLAMKKALSCAYVLLVLTGVSMAADPPEAPSSVMAGSPAVEVSAPVSPKIGADFRAEQKVVDNKFIALALVSTGSTFADSYTTLFARENWLAGKRGVCNAEVQSAYLYGVHPTPGRAYAVASVKSIGSVAVSYYLRKHHHRLWSLPLIVNSVMSLQGTTQNMLACN